MAQAVRGPGGSTAARLASAVPQQDHLVAFYDDDAELTAAVAHFLQPAIDRGEAVLVVATPEHLEQVAKAVSDGGGNPDLIVGLGARETLDAITEGIRVDHDKFVEVVGTALERTMAANDAQASVRVYGEMVALQWAAGDVAGAIALEDEWNKLLSSHAFALLCGYPFEGFADPEHTDAFHDICRIHTDVIPDQPFAGREAEEDQRRDVALLQHELRASRTRVADLERRLAAIGTDADDPERAELVAMVAHDLGNPTSVIRGVLSILQADWRDLDDDTVEEYLGILNANAARVGRLADDVLTAGRLDTGSFDFDIQPTDLTQVVEGVIQQVRATSQRTIELSAAADLPTVLADPVRQEQILHNLVSNALKYSGSDSTVRIDILPHRKRHVVQVLIHDQGDGISDEDMERLFHPFSRVDTASDSNPGGTGLGLFIAKALVEGQGGTIAAFSNRGQGSTFAYTVPIAVEAQ